MPAEKIQTGTPNNPATITVGWQRDGGVQLATLRPRDPGSESGITSTYPGADVPGEIGQWVDLTRHEINTLIRHLRRARDTAYGRDE